MLITFRSHIHISDVTNMLIIFFWIKLPLKLPKFLTMTDSTAQAWWRLRAGVKQVA